VNAITAIETRVNERIRAPRVRLVGADGAQLGIFVTSDAQKIADDQGLDLVEVAPNADPPVCRIMDFSKWKYEEAMKAKKARKNQTTVQVKEIKFRPKIGDHDYDTKKKHVVRFIDAGAKVKVTIMFRGREMVHAERGLAILERLAEDIRDIAHIENQPKVEGRNMFMLVSPSRKEVKPATRAEKGIAETEVAETEPVVAEKKAVKAAEPEPAKAEAPETKPAKTKAVKTEAAKPKTVKPKVAKPAADQSVAEEG
jgi:translation initiation factor IF-3